VIAIALLIAAQAVSGRETHGPFVIESKSIRAGFPYELEHKITTLTWKAESGLASYELTDSGEEVTFDYRVGSEPGMCGLSADLQRLLPAPPRAFGEDLLKSCRSSLSREQVRVLRAELASARPHFGRAYDAFFRRTTDQHGPSPRRCREDTFGHHGPICVAYWDEDRTAPARSRKKRR
jgi:hypothetical protein